jgi:hypothetical protein
MYRCTEPSTRKLYQSAIRITKNSHWTVYGRPHPVLRKPRCSSMGMRVLTNLNTFLDRNHRKSLSGWSCEYEVNMQCSRASGILLGLSSKIVIRTKRKVPVTQTDDWHGILKHEQSINREVESHLVAM